MTTEAELIQRLVVAQRARSMDVDAQPYSGLDRPAAYRVLTGFMDALGATPGMFKTGVHSDGVGVVAPIFAEHVGPAQSFRLPVATVTGLELEVGLVLGADLPPGSMSTAENVAAAVDHYFLGMEICGSRFADRKAAGANGGLADNMSALGYAIGPTRSGNQIDGLEVRLEFAGSEIYRAPAKHGFGSVLASLLAYANNQHPAFPLKAGTIVTTGSLCGLVPTTGTGHVVGHLGDESIAFDIL